MQRAFEICFAVVVMVFVFLAVQSRLSVFGALPETAECQDYFETTYSVESTQMLMMTRGGPLLIVVSIGQSLHNYLNLFSIFSLCYFKKG